MVFTSPIFLFLFLPVVLVAHLVAGRRLRNAVLLVASLVFYAWGETEWVGVMLVSIAANYAFARMVERERERGGGRAWVSAAVVLDLVLLAFFKYATWLWETAVALCHALGVGAGWLGQEPDVHLPLGISFYTFHAMSAVIDVHRGHARAARNPLDFALYIACFPQLVAGPIIRYHDVADQLRERRVTLDGFVLGIRRFIVGLAKKALLANTIAMVVDEVYATPASELSFGAAWLGLVAWGFQVYYDFSGYSDMAIGLGHMFGFKYRENFDHPFISRSITEFWRRWHISLTTWFRDYLYIPLGGSRRGTVRTYLNLATVFLLVGLWHGAAWFYVVFGAYHGVLMVLERGWLGEWLARRPAIVQHLYFFVALNLGWTIFRGESLAYTADLLAVVVDPLREGAAHPAAVFLDNERVLALCAGAVFSLPWNEWKARLEGSLASPTRAALDVASTASLIAIFFASILSVSAGTYNPFIYFRF